MTRNVTHAEGKPGACILQQLPADQKTPQVQLQAGMPAVIALPRAALITPSAEDTGAADIAAMILCIL